jgi:hypothetical protein
VCERTRILRLAALALPAASLVAAAAIAHAGSGTASSGETLDVGVRFSPARASSARNPRGLGFHVAVSWRRADAERPRSPVRLVVGHPSGMTINPQGFAQCPREKACPRRTQIGSGTATIDGRPSIQPQSVPLKLFLGTPLNGRPRVYLDAQLGATTLRCVEVYEAVPTGSGAFGYLSTIDLGCIPGHPPLATIVSTDLTIRDRKRVVRRHGRRRVAHLVGAPSGCAGSWAFSITAVLDDGEPVTAQAEGPCRS